MDDFWRTVWAIVLALFIFLLILWAIGLIIGAIFGDQIKRGWQQIAGNVGNPTGTFPGGYNGTR